jgi:hypothetical protein
MQDDREPAADGHREAVDAKRRRRDDQHDHAAEDHHPSEAVTDHEHPRRGGI